MSRNRGVVGVTKEKIQRDYFDWLYRIIYQPRERAVSKFSVWFRKLCIQLHNTEFTYTMALDGNRADDGINLRYRFGSERRYEDAMVASYLDDRECSVFEMMVALSIRCEDHIMDDPVVGNRTVLWFGSMIDTLGLRYTDDTVLDEGQVDRVIKRFLNRKYGSNGEGGLFRVEHPERDLRYVEIWYQMCWYLNEVMA